MAIGLAAATRSEREEVLVIKYSPFEAAAAVAPDAKMQKGETPLPTLGISELYACGTGATAIHTYSAR